MFYSVFTCISFTKLLFMPSYKSTDFEVHRNWLAITSTLPLNKWYYDEGSIWTLDYPPFFAWFEYILSFFAFLCDKEMLNIKNLNYASAETVLFQRLSVVFTDVVCAYGTYRCWRAIPSASNNHVLPILLLTNIGLLIVDHIHFQYNGIMFGILLISISHLLKSNNLWAAFWFTVLLNMKHIYIYIAPAYFVYLLRNHCLTASKASLFKYEINCKRISTLGSVVVAVFAISFGPFYDHLPQVLSRLFPFKRGLVHAYWAPNIWAVYNTVDAILCRTISTNSTVTSTATRGIIGDATHVVLPTVTPLTTLVVTAVVAAPLLLKLWRLGPNPVHCVRCIVLCGLTAFLCGWHVHEKAVLIAVVPMSILACVASKDAKLFVILSAAGHFSLFPLLYTPELLFIKLLLFVTYTLYTIYSVGTLYKPANSDKSAILSNIELLYLIGFAGLFLYNNLIHKLLGLDSRLPFLTLWFTSLYCFLGIFYFYVRYYYYFMTIESKNESDTKKELK